jgi:hypothetical protein
LPQKRILTSDIRASIENFYAPPKFKSSNTTNFLNKIEQEKKIFKIFRENYYVISEQSNIPASNLEDFLKAKTILNQTMQMMGTKKHIWKPTDQSNKPILNRQPSPRPSTKFQSNPSLGYNQTSPNHMVRWIFNINQSDPKTWWKETRFEILEFQESFILF